MNPETDSMLADRLSASQLEAILEIADDAIVCVDRNLRIALFNRGAERIFGYKANEAIGQPLNLLIPDGARPRHTAHVTDFHNSGASARQMAERSEISGRRKDGTTFPAEATISQLAVDGGVIFTAILRDVTLRKAHEQELENARAVAEAATQAKSMFLANMSHELRTPLNAVVGMTSLLLDTAITEEQRDYAQTIRASSETLLAIINDILDYSKIEIGRLEIESQPFDLRRAIEESLDLVAPIAGEKNLNLAYLIAEGVPAGIQGDVTRLRQILVNLLANATKFTHHGEVLVSVEGSPLDNGHFELHFSVADTGIGIPVDRIDQLFQSFTQVDASTTRKYGGSGLGLAISRRLAEMMGGRMWVDSVAGEGSTFHFTIEAAPIDARSAHNVLQERSAALSGKRLLIVDDNTTNRRILVKQALLWGMLPSAAATPVEAIDLIRHGHAFDAGILDMHMPDMDGLMLAREIRRLRDANSLPLIMLTSLVQRPKPAEAEQLAFSAFLNKPIKPTALFDALAVALRLPPASAPAVSTTTRRVRGNGSRNLRLLVAEDNTVNQKVMQQLLAHLGYQADVASTGGEALDALERQPYDVVLMDVQMPEMDGLEATRRIRTHFGASPYIVAMTANAMVGDREECLKAGMNDYLPKPVELTQLSIVLDRAAAAAGEAPNAVTTDAAETLAADGTAHETAPRIIDRRQIDQLRSLEGPDNPNLVAEIVDMFLRDAPQHLDGLAAAAAAGDAAALKAIAHRFLSSIENLGAIAMRERCMTLEALGREGRSDGAAELVARLRDDFAAAREALLSLLGATAR
ncbi:MAG TPA: response regulator [Rhodocyclaceae bacterium]